MEKEREDQVGQQDHANGEQVVGHPRLVLVVQSLLEILHVRDQEAEHQPRPNGEDKPDSSADSRRHDGCL